MALWVARVGFRRRAPVLLDRFLEDATEVDVDAIRDSAGETLIGGVMEHVEEAGVHSGDSACMLPPVNLSESTLATLEVYTKRIAERLGVVGLINVQFAVKRMDMAEQVFVIEANPGPRARSRSWPRPPGYRWSRSQLE